MNIEIKLCKHNQKGELVEELAFPSMSRVDGYIEFLGDLLFRDENFIQITIKKIKTIKKTTAEKNHYFDKDYNGNDDIQYC